MEGIDRISKIVSKYIIYKPAEVFYSSYVLIM